MRLRKCGALVLLSVACSSSDKAPEPGTKPINGSAAPLVKQPVKPPPKPGSDAVTTASPKQGSGGPAIVLVGDKIDGNALRTRHRARIKADTSPVTVLTGGTALELGEKLCEASVPKRPPETPVLIKPNMSGFNWFHDPKTHHGDNGVTGRTTDPEFVRGIVHCLKARGHTKITVADGFTGKASDWQRLIKVSGYAAMATDEKVDLVALDDDGVFDVEGTKPGKPLAISGIEKTTVPTLVMPKLLAEHLDHGLFISAPKIKTHRYAVYSLAIKGMQGTTMYSDASPAYQQKWRSHREINKALTLVKNKDPSAREVYVKSLETFAQRMSDVLELETPDVVLAEGAPAMSGDGFEKLYPSPEPVAIGGTNPILVDRIGAQYLGLWNNAALAAELGGHKTSPLLEVAAQRFGVDLANPKVTGNGAKLLDTTRPAYLLGMAEFVVGEQPNDSAPGGDPVDTTKLATELRVHRAKAPPSVDGQVDASWSEATPLVFDTDWAGRKTPTKTTVRAVYADAALYLLFELDGIDPFTDTARPTGTERVDLYEENCVELFFVPDPANRERYFEIELGPHGHFFDIAVDRKAKPRSNTAWSAELKLGTARDEAKRTAVIEVEIRSPDVIAAIKPNARLPLGLYRMEGKGKRQYLAAFPTMTAKPNFHVPEKFGTLVIDP